MLTRRKRFRVTGEHAKGNIHAFETDDRAAAKKVEVRRIDGH